MITAEQLYHRLKGVVESHHELKSKGFNQEILEVYLASKTKLSKKKIKELLNEMDKFYSNLIETETSEKV